MEENRNLSDRLLEFSIRVIKFLRKVENTIEFKTIKYQLIKAATSSGANYEESQGASSKADFINKVRIALKEMREANYWLKVLNGVLENKSLKPELIELINESEELKKILGTICKKASVNKNR
ncbi:MAG: four helix bundle protein [Bacteroidetes bacterium]|nr:four helix bundle protein [Bacteroidota bacterium]